MSVCELFRSFLLFPSNAVFSLPFTLLGLTAITQTSPFSPFVSALEAVNREPCVPLLVQVHCMQPDFMLVHLHASAHLTSHNCWRFPQCWTYRINCKCVCRRRGGPLPDGSGGHGYVQGSSHSNHFLSVWWCVYREGRGTGCNHKGV